MSHRHNPGRRDDESYHLRKNEARLIQFERAAEEAGRLAAAQEAKLKAKEDRIQRLDPNFTDYQFLADILAAIRAAETPLSFKELLRNTKTVTGNGELADEDYERVRQLFSSALEAKYYAEQMVPRTDGRSPRPGYVEGPVAFPLPAPRQSPSWSTLCYNAGMIKAVVFDYNEVINRRARVQPELLALAKELRKSGIKTAILSNLIQPLAWFIKERGNLEGFDPIIFSGDIGARKPDPRCYEFIIKKLGLKPEECLFVDNRADNIAGAEAVGMPVVLARTTAQTVEDIKRHLA